MDKILPLPDAERRREALGAGAGNDILEPSFVTLTPGSAVLVLAGGIVGDGQVLLARLVAHDPEGKVHDKASHDTHAQDGNHCEVAVAVLVPAGSGIFGPASIQGIGGDDAAEIAETRNQGRSRSYADLSMATLEDFIRPRHAVGHGWAQAETNHKQAAVPGPTVVQSKGDSQQAGDLDADCSGEDESSVPMETV